MPAQDDLHGMAPDNHHTALLLIDVVNDFEYPGGEPIFRNALPLAGALQRLKARARQAGVPVIYVNDNFGRWRSSFEQLLEHCLQPGIRGQPFVERLRPAAEDYFVLKPKHSGFYQTPLAILLKHLGTVRVILTGVCTNSCVLFTAQDAYMRDFQVCVPRDCSAACSEAEHQFALEQMRTITKADVRPSDQLSLET